MPAFHQHTPASTVDNHPAATPIGVFRPYPSRVAYQQMPAASRKAILLRNIPRTMRVSSIAVHYISCRLCSYAAGRVVVRGSTITHSELSSQSGLSI
jgi:hypothetical protein